MTRVMAQGVFDVLHPGHLYYLNESAELGDQLHVVIARDSRVQDEKRFLMSEKVRQKMVNSLEVVDEAHLGTEGDIYDILEEVQPDIITLGHDQPYDIEDIKREHEQRGYEDIEVERIGKYEPKGDEIVSSSSIKQRLREQ